MKKMKKLIKKSTILVLMISTALWLVACAGNQSGQSEKNDEDNTTVAVDVSSWVVPVDFPNGNLVTGIHHADIVIKDVGTITVELDAGAAPITVSNFMYLAQSGFYQDTTFHRIIEGFMMQGGAPKDPSEKPKPIKGEFANNGVDNNLAHVRGTISMARSNDKNSASSQFFIVHQDSSHLDGQYAAFGHVTAGMEFVDEICGRKEIQGDNGAVEFENQPVIEDIIVVD